MESKEWGQLMVCPGCQISGEPLEDSEENGISRAMPWKECPVFRMGSSLEHVESRKLGGLLQKPR